MNKILIPWIDEQRSGDDALSLGIIITALQAGTLGMIDFYCYACGRKIFFYYDTRRIGNPYPFSFICSKCKTKTNVERG